MVGIRSAALLLFLCLVTCSSGGQVQSPIEQHHFGVLTTYDELQAFLGAVANNGGIAVQHIGRSKSARNISLVTVTNAPPFGTDATKLRVLLFAQQHGDEPSGKEAMSMLVAQAASGHLDSLLETIDLMIIPQMNPDGSELGQRRTEDGTDLNRNHLLLTAPETKALHNAFYKWLPEVTVDIHEYGSFSSEWSNAGFIKTADVQLGMLTNLNTSSEIYNLEHRKIYPFIKEKMEDAGYSYQEYIVGSPASYIRHSTTEINDGRQSLGVLGSVSFIQEGRKWKTMNDQLERRARSQLASIEGLLRYSAEHSTEIKETVRLERDQLQNKPGVTVPIRMDHITGEGQMFIPVQMVETGRDTTWQVHPYRREVELLKSIPLPEKYLIKKGDSSVIALLRRHYVRVDTVQQAATINVTSYQIDSVGTTVIEGDTLPFVWASPLSHRVIVKAGDFLVNTKQIQSRLVAIALEPQSQWGLTKYEQFARLLRRTMYPISRIQ